MSHPVGAPLRDRMDVEFIEADVEIGFNLVDLAEQERNLGNLPLATRVLHDADAVFQDIQRRLERGPERNRDSFSPLVEELRREIDAAAGRVSRPGE